jgi:hypothetical protein
MRNRRSFTPRPLSARERKSPGTYVGAVSVSGTCQICEQRSADHQCERCGALVCDRHYDAAHGLCSECAAETGADDGDGADRSGPDPDSEHRI